MIESAAFRLGASTVLAATMMLVSCGHHDSNRPHAAYVPLAQLESVYGRLITAGNHPTPDQEIKRRSGWLVLRTPAAPSGACRSRSRMAVKCWVVLRTNFASAEVAGRLSDRRHDLGRDRRADRWRGGTGKLELLLRRSNGEIRWSAVNGGQTSDGPVCWAQELPGPGGRRCTTIVSLLLPNRSDKHRNPHGLSSPVDQDLHAARAKRPRRSTAGGACSVRLRTLDRTQNVSQSLYL